MVDKSQLNAKEVGHALFLEELQRIVIGPISAPKNEPEAITERRRFMEAIGLLTIFSKEMGASQELIYKLSAYYAALRDLGTGTTHPMLEAAVLPHSQPLSSDIWRSRATLAISLDYLVRSGLPLAAAVNMVAKTKGIEKLLSGSARNPTSSLKNWRVTLDNESVTNEAAKERWKVSRETLALMDEMDASLRQDKLKQKAEELLEVAANDISMIPARSERSV
jgi:hypothetical protein